MEWGHEEEGQRPFSPALEIPLAQGGARSRPPYREGDFQLQIMFN